MAGRDSHTNHDNNPHVCTTKRTDEASRRTEVTLFSTASRMPLLVLTPTAVDPKLIALRAYSTYTRVFK